MAVRALDEQGTTIDVVDVVNELRRRGVQFPVLLRFQDVLRAQVRRVNEAFRSAIAESNYGNVLSRHLSDQGQPAARGRRRAARRRPAVRHGPRVRLEGRADRVPAAHRRRDAARLQRRQGPHDAVADDRGPEARPEHRARHGEVLRVHRRQGPRVLDGLHVAARRARAARDARRRPLGRVVGHELEVRLERRRAHAHGQRARGERPASEARAAALPHRQPDRGHPGAQGGDQRDRADLRAAREARHPAQVPRRRRRPRRQLRQRPPRGGRGHQLRAPGIRERRRVHGQGGLRRATRCRRRRSSRRAAAR